MDFCCSSTCRIDSKKVAIVQFRGVADNSHERCHIYEAMEEVLEQVLTDEQPAGLILDLRELEYSWGDDMGRILCPSGEWDAPQIPVVVIASELNRAGLTSLVRDEMFSNPAYWLVEDEDQAEELMQSKLGEITSSS